METSVDVVVVGAGPIGLLLANLLGGLGVSARVLERCDGPIGETRAVSLDDEALRVLQATGLIEACSRDMILDGVGAVYFNGAGERLFQIKPRSREYGFPRAVLFHQPRLEATLRRGIERYPHVALEFGRAVQSVRQDDGSVVVQGVTSQGAPFEVRARYVVGCDGGRSVVRHSQGIRMSGTTFRERWLVLDATTDAPERRDVHFYCDVERPAVEVPGVDGHRRWEFMLSPGESDEELLRPERIDALLRCYPQPHRFEIQRKVVYTFHARNALQYRAGRVFLAGDAAHMMPPFFGQGVSTGFRDAHNLSWKLARVLAGRAGAALLSTYDEERRPHADSIIRASMMLGHVVMTRNPWAGRARDLLFKELSRHEATAGFLREARFKPTPEVRRGLVWRTARRGRLTGRMLPQPRVERAAGSTGMLDDALGNDLCLLGVDRDPARSLPDAAVDRLRRLGFRLLTVAQPGSDVQGSSERLIDADRRLAPARGGFLAVRPDRFIAAHFQAEQATEAIDHLAVALTR